MDAVPSGLTGMCGDFRHYCRIHGACRLVDRMALPFRSPSLFALFVYRFGRSVRFGKRRPRFVDVPLRGLHALLWHLSRYATRILLHPFVEVESNVWLASYAPLVLGAARIGAGTIIHQGVTLGAGGPREARGLPTIGRGVVLAPGAIVVGGVNIPDGTVVGPNTLVASSLAASGTWLGVPSLRSKRAPASVIPALPNGTGNGGEGP
jgi:serine O-acetyltransferase